MGKLYPPVIEGTIPAFYGTTLVVPFSMNRAVAKSDIKGFYLKIKTIQTNTFIANVQSKDYDTMQVKFDISEIENKLVAGQYYKLQIAYISDDAFSTIGYYSTVGVIKYYGKTSPLIYIDGLSDKKSNLFSGYYIGVFKHPDDPSEKVAQYKFVITLSDTDEVIYDSDWILHNTINDVNSLSSNDIFKYEDELNVDEAYYLQYKVITSNNMECASPRYKVLQRNSVGTRLDLELIAENNYDNGYVLLNMKNTSSIGDNGTLTGAFEISRQNIKNPMHWEVIFLFVLQNEVATKTFWRDFTVEHGEKYRYAVRQFNDAGVYTDRVLSNEVYVDFEDAFLFDGKRQLKIRYNPKVSSFKNDILESKTDTIGSKYPFIFRNGHVNYKEFPVSGLISYWSDEEELFMPMEDVGIDDISKISRAMTVMNNININEVEYIYHYDGEEIQLIGKEDPYNASAMARKEDLINSYTKNRKYAVEKFLSKHYKTTDLVNYNIAAERVFKLEVLEWLTNGKPKLFRSPVEGNYIVRLLNTSLTPTDSVGRMLHTFSSTAYEIADNAYGNLVSYNFIKNYLTDDDRFKTYYRSVPLGWQGRSSDYYYLTIDEEPLVYKDYYYYEDNKTYYYILTNDEQRMDKKVYYTKNSHGQYNPYYGKFYDEVDIGEVDENGTPIIDLVKKEIYEKIITNPGQEGTYIFLDINKFEDKYEKTLDSVLDTNKKYYILSNDEYVEYIDDGSVPLSEIYELKTPEDQYKDQFYKYKNKNKLYETDYVPVITGQNEIYEADEDGFIELLTDPKNPEKTLHALAIYFDDMSSGDYVWINGEKHVIGNTGQYILEKAENINSVKIKALPVSYFHKEEFENAIKEYDDRQQDLLEARQNYDSLDREKQATTNEISDLRDDATNKQNEINNLNEDMHNLAEDIERDNSELSAMRTNLQQLRTKQNKIGAYLNALNEYESLTKLLVKYKDLEANYNARKAAITQERNGLITNYVSPVESDPPRTFNDDNGELVYIYFPGDYLIGGTSQRLLTSEELQEILNGREDKIEEYRQLIKDDPDNAVTYYERIVDLDDGTITGNEGRLFKIMNSLSQIIPLIEDCDKRLEQLEKDYQEAMRNVNITSEFYLNWSTKQTRRNTAKQDLLNSYPDINLPDPDANFSFTQAYLDALAQEIEAATNLARNNEQAVNALDNQVKEKNDFLQQNIDLLIEKTRQRKQLETELKEIQDEIREKQAWYESLNSGDEKLRRKTAVDVAEERLVPEPIKENYIYSNWGNENYILNDFDGIFTYKYVDTYSNDFDLIQGQTLVDYPCRQFIGEETNKNIYHNIVDERTELIGILQLEAELKQVEDIYTWADDPIGKAEIGIPMVLSPEEFNVYYSFDRTKAPNMDTGNNWRERNGQDFDAESNALYIYHIHPIFKHDDISFEPEIPVNYEELSPWDRKTYNRYDEIQGRIVNEDGTIEVINMPAYTDKDPAHDIYDPATGQIISVDAHYPATRMVVYNFDNKKWEMIDVAYHKNEQYYIDVTHYNGNPYNEFNNYYSFKDENGNVKDYYLIYDVKEKVFKVVKNYSSKIYINTGVVDGTIINEDGELCTSDGSILQPYIDLANIGSFKTNLIPKITDIYVGDGVILNLSYQAREIDYSIESSNRKLVQLKSEWLKLVNEYNEQYYTRKLNTVKEEYDYKDYEWAEKLTNSTPEQLLAEDSEKVVEINKKYQQYLNYLVDRLNLYREEHAIE